MKVMLSLKSCNFKKIIPLFLSCLVILTACSPLDKVLSIFSDDGSGYIFKMSLDSDPINLDPQLASDKSSVAVAKNMFVGLLKTDSDGGISLAVAKDYSISDDRLTYTFYLDDRYKWRAVGNFTADVTANDFVFSFRRLFDPETGSPYAKDYFCIENSKKVYSGELSSENIGVFAKDDYTLEFRLEYQNAEFLELLTRLPASPCCEEFFNSCKGKYGLEAESIASDGPFFVRYWLHDPYGNNNYVRLRTNEGYSDVSKVYPAGVNYLIEKDKSVMLNDFTGGTTDVLLSDSFIEDADGFNRSENLVYSCGLVINPDNELLNRPEFKQILSLCIDRSELSSNTPDFIETASGIIPPSAVVGGTTYRSGSKEPEIESNPSLAEYKWGFTLSDSEKLSLNGINIMVPDSFGYIEYLRLVTGFWRDKLNIGIGLEVVNKKDYESRLKSGSFDICLAVLNSDFGSAIEYITPFSQGRFGFSDDECKKACYYSGKYSALTSAMYDINAAEQSLVLSFSYIPLWYMPQFLYIGEDSEGMYLDSYSGAVIFESAKHY